MSDHLSMSSANSVQPSIMREQQSIRTVLRDPSSSSFISELISTEITDETGRSLAMRGSNSHMDLLSLMNNYPFETDEDVDEIDTCVNKVRSISLKTKLLQSNLSAFQAQNAARELADSETEISFDKIVTSLNKTIERSILLETAYNIQSESAILQTFVRKNTTNSTDNELSAAEERVRQLIKKQHKLLREYSKVYELLQASTERTQKTKKAYLQGLGMYKEVLESDKVVLSTNNKQEDEEKMKELQKKLGILSVSQLLISHLLTMSDVNLIDHPEWVQLIKKCRTPITFNSLANREN